MEGAAQDEPQQATADKQQQQQQQGRLEQDSDGDRLLQDVAPEEEEGGDGRDAEAGSTTGPGPAKSSVDVIVDDDDDDLDDEEYESETMKARADAIEDLMQGMNQLPFQRQEPEYPDTYRINSEKEIATLAIVRNFERQFKSLYKQRKPLSTIFPNECGVEKFLCTTVRPTKLQYRELDRHDGIAAFVADYIGYDQLEIPTEPPAVMPSPTYTLWRQHGNSFDMSIVLCSLLEGAGFDAYCVFGYASREVTTQHRLRSEKRAFEKKEEAKEEDTPKPANKYSIKRENRLESKYLREMQQRTKTEENDRQREEKRKEEEERRARLAPPEDELHGLRVHCWVLVLPGQRGVHEAFFIEPTTGVALFTDDPNYLGIEYIWNSSNLWVNMQKCVNGLDDMEYDLKDTTCWEYMFPLDEDHAEEGLKVDLPTSWVARLSLSPQEYELRCPNGTRKLQFANEEVEIFAEYLNPNGLVKRVKRYETEELKRLLSITHTYKHRKDCLLKYVFYPATDESAARHDHVYAPGHKFKIRRHVYTDENAPTRRIIFYAGSRVDGLVERYEDAAAITETYRDRKDNLLMRQATFSDLNESAGGRRRRKVNINVARTPEDIEVLTERFARSPLVPAEKDMEEIAYFADAVQIKFHRGDGRISASTLELEKPHITDKQEIEPISDEYVDLYTPDSSSKKPRNFELFGMLQKCLRMEKACRKSIGLSMRETRDILEALERDDKEVELEISFYDTMRNEKLRIERAKQEQDAKNEAIRRAKQAEDYLAPYLVRLDDPAHIDEVTAAWLKDQVMDDFTTQLKMRFNFIEAECNREAKELQAKTAWFKQNQPSLSEEEERDFAKYRNEALFRMNILQKRLAQHKERTPHLSMQMEHKLRNDPRLAALHKQ
ncbi:hypothetical protein PTSG_11788 [Salpingoeca rosetta]|uniref:Dynein regulatory complex subunit 7 n=1 Tax=Salpingoeca rosetta (strain ATCC 50818 / BSB-021) TaxID=946362 RepID=F2TZ42_SALR5|nr:uncharacterized protein PTSG_11788 [Salpingoeca rosetta]EGD78866.1 hypothetical protein PTSG_11788 [Salpingoeca rosetta]|eukprot:XP_004997822.1 hypothetical protein PTSG_11788 [Salpingoeca rosetta]